MTHDISGQHLTSLRQIFFEAVAENLISSVRREDAGLDTLGDNPGKFPLAGDIQYSAARCWLVVQATHQRPFKISVWQPGNHLRIGVELPAHMVTRKASITNQLDPLFGHNKPHMRMRDERYFYDWHFDPVDLANAVEREKFVFYVQGVLETVLHVTV